MILENHGAGKTMGNENDLVTATTRFYNAVHWTFVSSGIDDATTKYS